MSINSAGFKRLKGMATASLLASGGAISGVAQAGSATFPVAVTRTIAKSGGNVQAKWLNIGNGFMAPSISSDTCQVVTRLFGSGSSPGQINTASGFVIDGCGNQAFGVHANRVIYPNNTLSNATDRHVSNLFSLLVDNAYFINPDDSVDLTDNVITSDTVQMSGLDVVMSYQFFGDGDLVNDRNVVRSNYSFTNNSGSEITTTAKIFWRMRVLGGFNYQKTSDGDSTFENSDSWFVMSESQVGEEPYYSPNHMFALKGSNAQVGYNQIAVQGIQREKFVAKYELTIAPGQTVRLVNFLEITETNAEAFAAAENFDDIDTVYNAGFFDGLSKTQIAQTVNYMPLGYDIDLLYDTDGDGVADADDVFPLDATESVDTDGDGTGNNADTDDDNDGVLDGSDAFPLDATESVDTDGDGTGNNADTDDDNDGVLDASDAFPLDATESVDTDGDGTGNNADTDDDNDGVLDGDDAFPLDATESVDTDGDGTGNNADTDDDNDGVLDGDDAFPLDATETFDTDGDGIGNNADPDDDNDGVLDDDDEFPLDATESVDTDGDGTGNNADTDDDNDGVLDSDDAFPLDATESVDSDGDGTGNNADPDDDNDGVLDVIDVFPLDATESVDTDGDGTGNNADTDDDNDGVEDADDAFPLDNSESLDTDGDGVGNNADTDDDNDGIPDDEDDSPLDPNDVNSPVFEELDTLTFEATGLTTNIQLELPEVTDDIDLAPTVVSDLDDALTLGEHVVTWTATDFSGNQSTAEQIVIIEDTSAPVFNPIEAIELNAEGRLTDISEAVSVTADDLVDGEIEAGLNGETQLVSGGHQVELIATDSSGNSETTQLEVKILPEFNLADSLVVEASGQYEIAVSLSGNAPDYPVEIDYEVILNGDVIEILNASIASGSQGELVVNVPANVQTTDQLSVSVTNITQAFISGDTQSSLTIVEVNLAPQLSLTMTQNNQPVSIVDPDNGLVTVEASVLDINQSDSHDLSWTVQDNAFIDLNNDSEAKTFEFDPIDLIEGTYRLTAHAIENNTDELLAVSQVQQIIVENLAELDDNIDSDNDGIVDSLEGYEDQDGDGIADYLDDDDNTTRLPTGENTEPMQTESGLSLSLGTLVQSSDGSSSQDAELTVEELAEVVGEDAADTNDPDFESATPLYNFVVDGLAQHGDSISLVLPLEVGSFLPADAIYRKYNTEDGWYTFVEDEKNKIGSALTDASGNCPAANDVIYTEGLTEGDNCIQLQIEDGGPNDIDFLVNGSVEDPGLIVVEKTNSLPVIVTDLAVTVDEETEVTLDALDSYDNDIEDELTFSWFQIDGQEVVLTDTTSATLTFTTPSVSNAETLTFELIVSDGEDDSAEIVEVIVEQVNQVPSISIDSHETSFEEGSSVTLTSQGSDPDNDNLTYLWEQVSGPDVSFEDETLAEVNFTLPQVSSDQIIELRVTVSDGELSSSETTSLTITNKVVVDNDDSKSSGGGSVGFFWMLMGLVLAKCRRKVD